MIPAAFLASILDMNPAAKVLAVILLMAMLHQGRLGLGHCLMLGSIALGILFRLDMERIVEALSAGVNDLDTLVLAVTVAGFGTIGWIVRRHGFGARLESAVTVRSPAGRAVVITLLRAILPRPGTAGLRPGDPERLPPEDPGGELEPHAAASHPARHVLARATEPFWPLHPALLFVFVLCAHPGPAGGPVAPLGIGGLLPVLVPIAAALAAAGGLLILYRPHELRPDPLPPAPRKTRSPLPALGWITFCAGLGYVRPAGQALAVAAGLVGIAILAGLSPRGLRHAAREADWLNLAVAAIGIRILTVTAIDADAGRAFARTLAATFPDHAVPVVALGLPLLVGFSVGSTAATVAFTFPWVIACASYGMEGPLPAAPMALAFGAAVAGSLISPAAILPPSGRPPRTVLRDALVLLPAAAAVLAVSFATYKLGS